MLIIGLTGSIASGKSTVADYFRALGVPIIDTDIIARELVAPGEPALIEITQAFSKDVIQDNGELNRSKLREIIFNNHAQRKRLEAILHPRIRKNVFKQLQSIDAPYVIIAIPLLFETDYPYPLDRVLVVDTTDSIQLKRLLERDDITDEIAHAIIATQLPGQQKRQLADDVLTNDADLKSLKSAVAKLHHQYLVLAGQSPQKSPQ